MSGTPMTIRPVQCDPGDHDPVTGERTDQHAMDLISVDWIVRKAAQDGWPNHELAKQRLDDTADDPQ